MSKDGDRYLDLLEAVLTGAIYEDPPLPSLGGLGTYDPKRREGGLDWPSRAFTMIGRKRLRNFRTLIERVIADGVPGDIMETGVWRGGACIMAWAVLQAHGIFDRRVIVADSFAGLPPPDPGRYPADAGANFHKFPDLAVPVATVRRNFGKFGLLDEQVVFLEGLFRDTMPVAPVERLAVLRLDGDMYESTIDPLRHLFDRIPDGGWIIVDDYGVVPSARKAVHDFLDSRGIRPALQPIDGVGVFFQKGA